MRALAKLNLDGNGTFQTRPAHGRAAGRAVLAADPGLGMRYPRPWAQHVEISQSAGSAPIAERAPVGRRTQRGAVLLEVVLALVLFVAAAAIIGSALNTSANGVERLRLSVHAANLATSVLAELQIGSRSTGDGSPEPFAPPFDTWMWQVSTLPVEEASPSIASSGAGLSGALPDKEAALVKVEVVVRDTDSDFVYRLGQVMPAASIRTASERGTQLF